MALHKEDSNRMWTHSSMSHFHCKRCFLVTDSEAGNSTDCCGSTFCRYCFSAVQRKGVACPGCGTVQGDTSTDKNILHCQGPADSTENKGEGVSLKEEELGQSEALNLSDSNLSGFSTNDKSQSSGVTERPSGVSTDRLATPNPFDDVRPTECHTLPARFKETCKLGDLPKECKSSSLGRERVDESSEVVMKEGGEEKGSSDLQSTELKDLSWTLTRGGIEGLKNGRVGDPILGLLEGFSARLLATEQQVKTQHKVLINQEKRCLEIERRANFRVMELERKFHEQEQKFELILQSYLEKLDQKLAAVEQRIELNTLSLGLNHTFFLEHFSVEKSKNKVDKWKSPAMFTHVGGYKFCVGVDANGCLGCRGSGLYVALYAMPGEHDQYLVWPAAARFTLELVNQCRGQSAVAETEDLRWKRPTKPHAFLCAFQRISMGHCPTFIEHYNLAEYLCADALQFNVSRVQVIL